MFVLSSGELLCLSWEIQSCDFNLCRVALIMDIFRQPHYQLQGGADCCWEPRSSVAPVPWKVELPQAGRKNILRWPTSLCPVSHGTPHTAALQDTFVCGHTSAAQCTPSKGSTMHTVLHPLLHVQPRGLDRGAHIQPTAPGTRNCMLWAPSNRDFGLQVLFSWVTAHRPSNPVDRTMGCNSGWGVAPQAKGVSVTQQLNRYHTGTKTLFWPGFSSVHVCGWCLHYLNPLQLSQRGSGALGVSPEGRQNWDQAESARESMHESERRLTLFFFLEKALLSGHENNYTSFMGNLYIWNVQMTYLINLKCFTICITISYTLLLLFVLAS